LQGSTDAAIRELLIPLVHSEHSAQHDTIYIEEFALYGGTNRADLAALNVLSHGYEIKSDRDSLVRLPEQVNAYNAVFERITLVSATRHIPSARPMIRDWWGIIEARTNCFSELKLERIRDAAPNPEPHAAAIASLLWRPEALRILTSLGLDHGLRSKPMDCLIERLAEVPAERLARYVREAVRARGDWRSAARLKQYDVKPQRRANHFPSLYTCAENSDQ
jgi:hypothetical protein